MESLRGRRAGRRLLLGGHRGDGGARLRLRLARGHRGPAGCRPLPMLAAAAAHREAQARHRRAVLPPRNPVLLARELATVDVISGGRLLPAGGLGINIPAELEAMGVARGERVGRLEESVAIVKALWPGEPVTMRGRFWSLTDVRLEPRPMRRRSSSGSAARRRRRCAAGRIADGWAPSSAPTSSPAWPMRSARAPPRRDARSTRTTTARRSLPRRARTSCPTPRRPGAAGLIARDDHIAYGTTSCAPLQRFRAAGATKFVASDRRHRAWLREMYTEAIEPFEAVA